MSTHVVTRPLPMGKEMLEPGAEVDASTWRNVRLLVEQRYLQPIPGTQPETVQPDEREKRMGRKGRDGSQSGN